MTQKSRNFHLLSHHSLSMFIGGRGDVNSIGLECQVWNVTLTGLRVKEGGFWVMFVKVCEWFNGSDRLEIIFKSRKNKITQLSFILNMIRNYHYIIWFVVEKIVICKNENNIFRQNNIYKIM